MNESVLFSLQKIAYMVTAILSAVIFSLAGVSLSILVNSVSNFHYITKLINTLLILSLFKIYKVFKPYYVVCIKGKKKKKQILNKNKDPLEHLDVMFYLRIASLEVGVILKLTPHLVIYEW